MNEQSLHPPASRPDADTPAPGLHRALRALPGRTAPAALEARVMAEISRRAALPWWRQSFARWPLPARVLLLAASAATAGLVLALGAAVLSPAAPVETASFPAALQAAWKILPGVFEKLIPSSVVPWLHAAIGVIVAAYAGLLAFGGAACRLFWQDR